MFTLKKNSMQEVLFPFHYSFISNLIKAFDYLQYLAAQAFFTIICVYVQELLLFKTNYVVNNFEYFKAILRVIFVVPITSV